MISSKDLCDKINAINNVAVYIDSFDGIKEFVQKNCKKNDLLITMGAGNVDIIGEHLLKK